MTIRILNAALLAAGILALAGLARAAPGYIVGSVDLQAGPGVEYPVVASLPPGTPTEIYGCLPGWTWCDIAVNGPEGGVRGWATGERLQLVYGNQPVLLPQYGAQFGLPLVGFDIDRYWGSYYRGRPWYGQEARWRGDHHGGAGPRPGPGYGGHGPGYGSSPGHGPGPGPGDYGPRGGLHGPGVEPHVGPGGGLGRGPGGHEGGRDDGHGGPGSGPR